MKMTRKITKMRSKIMKSIVFLDVGLAPKGGLPKGWVPPLGPTKGSPHGEPPWAPKKGGPPQRWPSKECNTFRE